MWKSSAIYRIRIQNRCPLKFPPVTDSTAFFFFRCWLETKMCNDYVESQDSHSAGRDAIWKNQFVASRHSVAPSLDHLAFINGLLAGHLHEWSGAWAFWIVKDAYMICFTPRLKMWKSWHKMMISFHASTQYFYQGGESQRMDTFQQSLGVPVSPPQICLPNWAELLGSEVGDLPNVWYKSPSRIWDQTVYLVFRLVEFGSKRKEWKRGENPGVSPVKLHVVNHLLHALKKPWIALLKNPGVWAYRRQQWLCLLMEKFRVPFPLLLPKPVFIIVDQFEELLKKPGQQFGLCARKNYGSRCFRNWRLGLEDWWEITTVYRELRSCGFFTTGTSTCQKRYMCVYYLLLRRHPDQAMAWADAICHQHGRNNYARILFVVTQLFGKPPMLKVWWLLLASHCRWFMEFRWIPIMVLKVCWTLRPTAYNLSAPWAAEWEVDVTVLHRFAAMKK